MADIQDDKERLARLRKRAEETEKMVAQLRHCVGVLKQKAVETSNSQAKEEASLLEKENIQLRREVNELRKVLVDLEARNGIVQVPLPSAATAAAKPSVASPQPAPAPSKAVEPKVDQQPKQKDDEKPKEKAKKKKEKPKPEKPTEAKAPSQPVDVSRCDFRVGKIVSCEKHPDADILYVEKIDVGEGKPRTVLSGLVNDYTLEEMQDRMVVVICNLRSRLMRGILSEAMVMCAVTTDHDKSEFIDPPAGSVPGDRVIFEGYEGTPVPLMNPKKKVFEQVQPDLHTDENCVANYKGVPFNVPGKGVCRAASFSNCGIK